MKKYIKPQTNMIALSLGTNILAASPSFTEDDSIIDFDGVTGNHNVTDANAKFLYDDEEDDYWE